MAKETYLTCVLCVASGVALNTFRLWCDHLPKTLYWTCSFYPCRGYYVRAKALSTVVTSFVQQNNSGCQVVSLGAGFDTTYFRLHTEGQLSSCKYFEVYCTSYPVAMLLSSAIWAIYHCPLYNMSSLRTHGNSAVAVYKCKLQMVTCEATPPRNKLKRHTQA